MILDRHPLDVVVDAIDGVSNKCCLIDSCRRRGVPIVVSGALGGKADPTQFREADMTRVEGDGLLRRVRSKLRAHYGYPAGDGYPPRRTWGVPCVYSPERPQLAECAAPAAAAAAAATRTAGTRATCDTAYGTFCPAAGSLGFA